MIQSQTVSLTILLDILDSAELCTKYSKLVYKLAHKYHRQSNISSLQLEDFAQEGFIALLRAQKDFKKSAHNTFLTFAYSCIKNALVSLIRSHKSKHNEINETNLAFKKFSLAKQSVMDSFEDEADFGDIADNINHHTQLFQRLNSEDQLLLQQKYSQNLTLREIGKMQGISAEAIRKKLNKILVKLSYKEAKGLKKVK